jgi:hypothetical protein
MCASDISLDEQMNVELAAEMARGPHSYMCDECNAMVDSLQGFCRAHNAVSKPSKEDFVNNCRDAAGPKTTDFDNLTDKCSTLYDFVSHLYCPLDPCVQITTEKTQAHDAICHLLRCETSEVEKRGGKQAPNVPHTCPVYVQHILDACKANNESKGADRVGGENDSTCHPFAAKYTREGCEMVLKTMVESVNPLDLCNSMQCDGVFASDLDKYCRDVLHLPSDKPVPEPGYLRSLNDTNEVFCANNSRVAIHVQSASFGAGCNARLKDNLLHSVREQCNGKIKCTFGNLNLPNMTSAWDPVGRKSCEPKFEVVYSCQNNATHSHTVTAPEVAKFRAIPFDCVHELVGKDALRAFKIRNELS